MGLGFRTFTAGETLTAANVMGYLMRQAVMVFADATARDAAIAAPEEGMLCFLTGSSVYQSYDGGSWTTIIGSTGNIAGNAATATALATARTIDITGDITATAVAFNGTANIAISAAVNNDSHSHTGSTISNLAASDVTSGTFDDARIPNLSGAKITSGTVADARLEATITRTALIGSSYIQTSANGSNTSSTVRVVNDDYGLSRDATFNLLRFHANGERRVVLSSSALYPTADNSYDIGISGFRWDDVWATNGTIQTSDQRDKADIADLDLGLAFLRRLRPVMFRRQDRNGPAGKRTHHGFIAQEVKAALDAEGVDRAVWIHAKGGEHIDNRETLTEDGVEVEPVLSTDRQALRDIELLPVAVKAILDLDERLAAAGI